MEKIRIAGAGLAGLTAAINLAKAGKDVEVFEVNKDCGYRFHGDIKGIENWSYEEDALIHLERMNIKLSFPYYPTDSFQVTNRRQSIDVKPKRPVFYLVKRGPYPDTLDTALKKQAEKSGVSIHFNTKIREEHADIIATGPIGKQSWGIDKGIVFKTNIANRAEMLLGDDVAYKGYAYLLVVDGYGCMCTVLTKKFDKAQECFENAKIFFVDKYKMRIENPKSVGGVGYFSPTPKFADNNRIYVGEAAGIQDGLFGFGIRSAIYSGYLAAESIIDGTHYESAASTVFVQRQKASLANIFMWRFMGKEYNFPIKVIRKYGDFIGLMQKVYNYHWRHKVVLPFAYIFSRRP